MQKKIFFGILFLWLLLLGAGYLTGSYFVDYALKRGSGGSPPAACARIANPALEVPPMPASRAGEEVWTIFSADGLKLAGTCFYPRLEQPHRWAILVHGYGRDRQFSWNYAEEYLKAGYRTFSPDLRGAGESEGEYLTMGDKESDDVRLWVEEILRRDPKARIVLHGVSMGAATVMMAAAKDLPSNVKAVIEDCGYTSAYEMFGTQLGVIFGLPEVPIMPCVELVCRQKTGTSLSWPTPYISVRNSSIPMLFIHGDEDKLVPCRMMQDLYEASASSRKECMTVAGAGHADAMEKDKEAYFRRIFEFLKPLM